MSVGPAVRLRKQKCPTCKSQLDAASVIAAPGDDPDDVMPEAGDVTACLYCGAYLVYSPTMRIRPARSADLDGLDEAQRYNLNLVRQFARAQAKH